ncbi:hypothetical protein D3C75_1001110 [compost metagenome]
MVVMVLSQFCTFTVFREMSVTLPSAPYLGISIQSPTRTMSLEANCTPATSPSRESLKMMRSTADKAPIPLNRRRGLLPARVEMARMAPMIHTKICSI